MPQANETERNALFGDLPHLLRYATRGLVRTPVFTLATVATLAVGLGGVAAIGTLAQSLLRALPFPEADRLVAVWETRDGEERFVAPANYLDWRRELESFQGRLAAHSVRGASLTVDGVAFRTTVAMVSGNFFEVLGVQPTLGGGFDPGLNTSFPERQVVISHETWVDWFGGDDDVLGQTLLVEDESYEIVGVASKGLSVPDPGLAAWVRSRSEAPEIRFIQGDLSSLRDAWYFQVIGRLADGTTLPAAQSEIGALAARLEAIYPESNEGHSALIRPLLDEMVGDFKPLLASLAAAVLLLLLAAVVNVSHLASGRRAEKAAEAAIHVALGAGRARLVVPVALEGALLGLVGGLGGVLLAGLALDRALPGFTTVVPRAQEVSLNAAGVTAVLALATALGVGISMAAFAAAGGARPSATRLRGGERVGSWRGQWLIAAQTAAAVALLASAGLLGRSLWTLGQVDLGFDAEDIATLRIAQPDAWIRSYDERIAVFEDLRSRVSEIPAIEAVAFSARSPLTMGAQAGLRVVGWDRPDEPGSVSWAPVHPDYFAALGVEILSGRGFNASDAPGSMEVAVINQALARSVFPGDDAVGRTVSIGLDGHDRPLTIVGVVSDTRTRGPASPPGPVLYRPIAQTDGYAAESVLLVARIPSATPADLAGIREAVRAVRPDLPVYAEALGTELAADFHGTQASLLRIVGVFALAALLLGAIGVYGVTAHATRRRRREIGVRMALGATRERILSQVVGSGLIRVAWGVPVGVLASTAVGQGLRSALVGVTPLDPIVLGGVCLIVFVVSAGALFLPARNAASTDPTVATRAE